MHCVSIFYYKTPSSTHFGISPNNISFTTKIIFNFLFLAENQPWLLCGNLHLYGLLHNLQKIFALVLFSILILYKYFSQQESIFTNKHSLVAPRISLHWVFKLINQDLILTPFTVFFFLPTINLHEFVLCKYSKVKICIYILFKWWPKCVLSALFIRVEYSILWYKPRIKLHAATILKCYKIQNNMYF